MFNVYKVVVTFDTGMEHVDDVGGEWKTVRETTSALDRICHGPAKGFVNEVKAIDALDLVVFHARKNKDGRLAIVST